MQAREHPAIPVRIEQGQREALVPSGLLERVVPDETEARERLALRRFEDRGARGHGVELAGDGMDLLEMSLEHSLQAPTIRPASKAGQAPFESRGSAREPHDRDKEGDDRGDEEQDDADEVLVDERAEVDGWVLLGVAGV
jgi:hypothetical protein